MLDVAYDSISYRTEERRIERRPLPLAGVASDVQRSTHPTIYGITSGEFTVIEDERLSTVRFPGDPYGPSSLFEVDGDRAHGQLVTAWSPTRPIYQYEVPASGSHVFSDDIGLLKSLAGLLAREEAADELFGIWTLTGLPAAQFGLIPMRTPWAGIKQVPAGVQVQRKARKLAYTRAPGAFWNVDEVPIKCAQQNVREAFEKSVATCAEGQTAVLASGGIDSSAIAGACHRLGTNSLLVTNVYPDAPETDERHFVAALESAFGLRCLPIPAHGASLLSYASHRRQARPFRGLFRADDQEVIDRTKPLQVATILDGLGGDELFAVRDYPIGKLSNSGIAKQLLPSKAWSAIYGRRHPIDTGTTLLPPFTIGVDAQELLWEFQFRGLTEMACPQRSLRRVYSLMFESNFWEEARWLSDEVFGPQGTRRRHPFIGTGVIQAVLSAPQRAFRRAPVLKEFQRAALQPYLPREIATRYGGAEQTANVMFNLIASLPDFSRVVEQSLLSANRFIDNNRLQMWYREGLKPTSTYQGGPIEFDHLWATICYDRWLNDQRVACDA